jgi:hypothetical protein
MRMELGSWGKTTLGAARVVLGGLLFAFAACDSGDPGGAGASCVDDADCADGQHCELGQALTRRPMIALPCPNMGISNCALDSDCASGEICAPASLDGKSDCGKICKSGCPMVPCASTQTCENARCRNLRCDETGGPVCETHWRCDPAAAVNEPAVNVGSREIDSGNAAGAIAAGCVRMRCNEEGGFTCKDFNGGGWVCDPENTTDGSGCRALSCAEKPGCSNDTAYICEPTSTNPRPADVDPHGCVRRNCEEGVECMIINSQIGENVGVCDFTSQFADEFGCVPRPCETDAECLAFELCDPAGVSNIWGCRARRCDEGGACQAGYHCDPSLTGTNRCVRDSGGSGGSSGSAGATGGGTGGSAGDTGSGHCVDG